jgi:hypothetical protein
VLGLGAVELVAGPRVDQVAAQALDDRRNPPVIARQL